MEVSFLFVKVLYLLLWGVCMGPSQSLCRGGRHSVRTLKQRGVGYWTLWSEALRVCFYVWYWSLLVLLRVPGECLTEWASQLETEIIKYFLLRVCIRKHSIRIKPFPSRSQLEVGITNPVLLFSVLFCFLLGFFSSRALMWGGAARTG